MKVESQSTFENNGGGGSESGSVEDRRPSDKSEKNCPPPPPQKTEKNGNIFIAENKEDVDEMIEEEIARMN